MAKVCIVASYAPSLINFRGDLIRRMIEQGHSVTAIAPEDTRAHEVMELGCSFRPFRLERTGLNPAADYKSHKELKRLFAEEQPDVVLSYTLKPNLYASLAARSAGVPSIYALITGLGYVFSGTTLKQKALRSGITHLLKKALRHNRAVMFQNPDDQALFSQHGITRSGQKTVVVPGSGVNLKRFAYSEPKTSPCRFLLIARLVRQKGVYQYVQAAKQVKAKYPDAEFHLLGRVDSNPGAITRQELESWVEQGLIQYHGYQSDVRPHLHENCTVYVLPSMYREGVPRSILEALATGRCVITTDAPGCRETVQQGSNGFLVKPGDTEQLAQRMEHCITHTEEVLQMGRESRRLAESTFDVNRVNKIMLQTMNLLEEDLQ